MLNESIGSYVNEFMNNGRAVGELEHPTTGAKINLDRIACKIVGLHEDGNSWMGRAQVLDTPCGKIA